MKLDLKLIVAILRTSPNLDDQELFGAIVAAGIESTAASRLVVLLPMAYARLLLAPAGAKFSEYFQHERSDGTLSPLVRLTDEPFWTEAIKYAESEVKSGISRQDILLVAGRSAEFDAANQLLNSGSKLQDVRFSVPIIRWPS